MSVPAIISVYLRYMKLYIIAFKSNPHTQDQYKMHWDECKWNGSKSGIGVARDDIVQQWCWLVEMVSVVVLLYGQNNDYNGIPV